MYMLKPVFIDHIIICAFMKVILPHATFDTAITFSGAAHMPKFSVDESIFSVHVQ